MTVVPTIGVDDESVVMIVGEAFCTMNNSQLEVAGLLLESPLYEIWKLKLPVELKRTARESGIDPPATETVDTTVPGTEHAEFENRL